MRTYTINLSGQSAWGLFEYLGFAGLGLGLRRKRKETFSCNFSGSHADAVVATVDPAFLAMGVVVAHLLAPMNLGSSRV